VPQGTIQLETGTVVAGYRIDGLISRGGMGVVYRATNVALGQSYALKVIAPELADDPTFRERFQREIRLAASLHNPHVVPVHYAGEHDGLPFFVMDLIEGTDLHEVLLREGALEPSRAVALLTQLTSALDAAHRKGLVHRDVKPANVLISVVDGEERAYLTDFGLAKRPASLREFTKEGFVVGTVDFMPPEQITGSKLDARADVYALGCVFFYMLSGHVPFERDNTVAKMWAQVHDPRPSCHDLRADLPPTVDGVIQMAMAKDPADRYMSAGDLARDAAAAVAGSRFTGPHTIVATGEAAPRISGEPSAGVPTAAGAERPASETAAVGAAMTRESAPEALPTVGAMAPGTASGPGAAVTAPPPPATPPPSPGLGAGSGDGPSWLRKHWWAPAGMALIVAIALAAVIAATSGSGGGTRTPGANGAAAKGTPYGTGLTPVPTNHVTGSGMASVRLDGDVVTVTIGTNGLLDNAPHALHLHAGARGICPDASAAHLHNGHRTISTLDGGPFYGHPQAAFTTRGDTSPDSILAFTRYPHTGAIRYRRTFRISPPLVEYIRANNAVLIVHGVDYNHNGLYDSVLDRSDLNRTLPGEATAPALCGPLRRLPGGQGATASVQRRSEVYVAALNPATPTPTPPARRSRLCHLDGVGTASPDGRTQPV
jgi:Protein kinase domain